MQKTAMLFWFITLKYNMKNNNWVTKGTKLHLEKYGEMCYIFNLK